jgi:hypothetical protein
MKRHWKTLTTSDGVPVTLYTFTTDHMVEADFAKQASLPLNTSEKGTSPTDLDHKELALDAFGQSGLTDNQNILHVLPAASVPSGDPDTKRGGPVWRISGWVGFP